MSDSNLSDLLESRVVMVTGKGGTGKTTYAAAIAVLAAAKGKRVVLAEIDSQRPSFKAIFDTPVPYEPLTVIDNLDVCNIVWDGALDSWMHAIIPSRRVVRMIRDNTVIRRFLNFLPGGREIAILSRVDKLAQQYDITVVDMPASGHAFSLLDVTRSALGLFRSGPVKERAEELIDGLILSERTRVVFVGLPEDMVVNETVETWQRMKKYNLLGSEPFVFLNKATLPSLNDEERELLARLAKTPLEGVAREFVQAGFWEDRLEQATAEARETLTSAMPNAPILVPPSGAGGNPRNVVHSIAVFLGRQIGLTRRDLTWS